VFLLWLDCIWQLIVQFPTAFEYNEQMLLAIGDHSVSGRFGTFLWNCERERVEKGIRAGTPSLWSFLSSAPQRQQFTNPGYQREDKPLFPSVNPRCIRLWEGYFFRWDSSVVINKGTGPPQSFF
jgi:hypothetical protein